MKKNVNLIELDNRLFELMLDDEIDEEAINNLEKIAQIQGIETEFLKAKLAFRTARLYSTYIKNDTNSNLSLEEIDLNNQIHNSYERILT